MDRQQANYSSQFKQFLIIIALSSLSASTIMVVLSNYFKTVYAINEVQRGFIELPRELPGVLTIFIVAFLSGYSNITISLVAQSLAVVGIAVLGFSRPEYNVMLLFIFINSLGHHISMPIHDSISMSLSGGERAGRSMGLYKGVQTGFAMVASVIVFVGFKIGWFSFNSPVIGVFVFAVIIGIIAILLTANLYGKVHAVKSVQPRMKLVYRREYKFYYALTVLYGLQKQIMLVYSPWVIISIFNQGPETLALLTIIGSFIGMFFIPKLGDWLDQFGVRKLLFVDAWSYVGVYLAFGISLVLIRRGALGASFLPVGLIYIIFILDKMSNQMGMIRTLYLKKIALDETEVTPTLSLGLALDHIVSISAAVTAGYVWRAFGAEYIFFALAIISLLNVYIANQVHLD